MQPRHRGFQTRDMVNIMRIISHRGNLTGENSKMENRKSYIETALKAGFDCEIDLWKIDDTLYLGHDQAQYKVTYNWLINNCSKLWIHCKNLEAINYLRSREKLETSLLNYFFHDGDDLALTSKKVFWTYPNKPTCKHSVLVLKNEKDGFSNDIFGVCTDFPMIIKDVLEK